MSLSNQSISASRARIQALTAEKRVARPRSQETASGPYAASTPAAHTVDTGQKNDLRHYQAIRDTAFAAIRPICNRFAGQALKIAIVPRRKKGQTRSDALRQMKSAARSDGYLGHGYTTRQKEARRLMPKRVEKSLPHDAVVLDDHEFTEAIYRPNNYMTAFNTMACMCASVLSCGRALMLWDEQERSTGFSGEDSASAYYLPMHWARPLENTPALQGWKVTPPNVDAIDVHRGQFVYFNCPDPANPFGSLSPMRSVRRPINTEDKIADAQQAEMDNLISPSYAVVVGQQMGPGGQKQRARLSKKQRRDVVNAVKTYVGGALRKGEPMILDALIEDMKDISPRSEDIGFEKGAKLTEEKIMKAYGVSPLIAGWVQNANRAGSVVAHELFYDVVLNPLLVMSGEAFTHALGPAYNTDEYRVVIYHEAAVAEDSESMINRAKLFPEAMRGSEKRRFIRTGQIEWVDEDAPESAEFSNVWTGNEDRDEQPETTETDDD